jgi:adenosylcobinamide kinase/adenosylcobinamide-phosphate guanylyltransferase
LTLWLSNLILLPGEIDLDTPLRDLVTVLQSRSAAIAVVTNEVGSGIVPDNPLARRFRDLCGSLNQRVAAISDRVLLLVAGRALELPAAASERRRIIRKAR